MAESFSASDYVIFDDAIGTTKKMNEDLSTINDSIREVNNSLNNESVFMGPAADESQRGLESVKSRIEILTSNYNTIANYLDETAESYKSGDEAASKQILNVDNTSGKIAISAGGGSSSEWAVTIDSIKHMNESESGSGDAERQKRIDYLGGFQSSDAAQSALMTTIQVPVWDGQKETTMPLTVNKKLVDNYMGAFQEVCDLRFPVNPNPAENAFSAYEWEHYRPSGQRSDHALGGTFDINTGNNWGTGDGSQYSVRNRQDVVKVFENYGFFWGGNWDSDKDDMHFSFTGW